MGNRWPFPGLPVEVVPREAAPGSRHDKLNSVFFSSNAREVGMLVSYELPHHSTNGSPPSGATNPARWTNPPPSPSLKSLDTPPVTEWPENMATHWHPSIPQQDLSDLALRQNTGKVQQGISESCLVLHLLHLLQTQSPITISQPFRVPTFK